MLKIKLPEQPGLIEIVPPGGSALRKIPAWKFKEYTIADRNIHKKILQDLIVKSECSYRIGQDIYIQCPSCKGTVSCSQCFEGYQVKEIAKITLEKSDSVWFWILDYENN